MDETKELIARYYDAFNRQDNATMLDCLADGFVHEVSQGPVRSGKKLFGQFLEHMHERYHEKISDLVIMVSHDGARAAAEFHLDGEYLKTDEGLPEADGQTYSLRVGAFFALEDGRITRVSTHYNLADWTRQVVG
ncbi:MAG: ketosteroid isomerase-related protein [Pseudomonadota bacterium]